MRKKQCLLYKEKNKRKSFGKKPKVKERKHKRYFILSLNLLLFKKI